jgi:hypothetical protein
VDGRDKPGDDEMICWADAVFRWMALCGAIVLIAAIVASLIPANMQIRTGLHWQVEHFLLYFLQRRSSALPGRGRSSSLA